MRLRESGLYSNNFLNIPNSLFYKITPKVRGGEEEEPASPCGKSRPDPKWWWPSQSCWQVRFFSLGQSCWQVRFFFSRPFFLSHHHFCKVPFKSSFFANCPSGHFLQIVTASHIFMQFCNLCFQTNLSDILQFFLIFANSHSKQFFGNLFHRATFLQKLL